MFPNVHPVHHPATGTWSYVVADPVTRQAALIDPVLDYDAQSLMTGTTAARPLLDIVEQEHYEVRWLLETHAHADHLSSARWLKGIFPQAVYAVGRGIIEVQRTFARQLQGQGALATDGSQFDHLWADGEEFIVGSIPAFAIPVPGHTPDSLAYLIGDALFTGDSLFMPDAGSARCDFPGGDAATLYRSIQHLYATLPAATRIFVCHDYGVGGRAVQCETTLGEQQRVNLHVAAHISEVDFVELRQARDATLAPPALLEPSLQANLRGGVIPTPDPATVKP